MRGYPRSRIRCTFDICTDEGDRQQVSVDRYLMQLGFSQHVHMTATGSALSIPATVKKMVAKCSTHRGWPAGQNPAAILSDFLARFIPREAFSEIISRNSSYTFLCHVTYCDAILKISGTDGIFTKMHEVADKDKMELLWLEQATTLEDALVTVEKNATILGLAEKGQQGFLAYRFRTHGDLVRFAKENGVDQDLDLQRWKVSGLPVTTGIAGVHQILQTLSWDVEEVVYQDTDHVVFTSSRKGKSEKAHFICEDQPRTVRFKALNAAARSAAAREAQAERPKAAKTTERSAAQKDFLAKLEDAKTALAQPASP